MCSASRGANVTLKTKALSHCRFVEKTPVGGRLGTDRARDSITNQSVSLWTEEEICLDHPGVCFSDHFNDKSAKKCSWPTQQKRLLFRNCDPAALYPDPLLQPDSLTWDLIVSLSIVAERAVFLAGVPEPPYLRFHLKAATIKASPGLEAYGCGTVTVSKLRR